MTCENDVETMFKPKKSITGVTNYIKSQSLRRRFTNRVSRQKKYHGPAQKLKHVSFVFVSCTGPYHFSIQS
jgi:hypothetical protein